MTRARHLSVFPIAKIANFAIVLANSIAAAQQADAKPWTAQDDHKNMLGQLGIKKMIDARTPNGWQTLRSLLAADASQELHRSALAQINLDLPGMPADCWRFFELLFDPSPKIGTVRQLARRLEILPSTLMSRFFRAGLPAPKKYLALSRLIRAARLFENPGLSVASVANHLDYSSPQSFGRHVRTMMRISPVMFRGRYDGQGMVQYFRTQLILPYVDTLRTFHPVDAYPGWMTDKKSSTLAS